MSLNHDDSSENEEPSVRTQTSLRKVVSSLRVRLRQSIENEKYQKTICDSLIDELERLKTEYAVEASQLREEVDDLRLSCDEANTQLDRLMSEQE